MLNMPKSKKNYYILIAAVMSMWITVSTVYMVLPLYFQKYGISTSENGILIAIGTFAGVISSIIAGKYADSVGRKPVAGNNICAARKTRADTPPTIQPIKVSQAVPLLKYSGW